MKDASQSAHRALRHGAISSPRLRITASAADLAHALICGTSDLRAADRRQIFASIRAHGSVDSASAAYVTALEWAAAVSDGRRPPNPIVFRSLGRDDDWLAALVFLASALDACGEQSAQSL